MLFNMLPYVDHLKNQDATSKYLETASGRHVAKGDLVASYSTGASPNHTVYLLMAVAHSPGGWDSVEGVWYNGTNIPAENYEFLDGTQTAPSTWFPDFPAHTGTVMLAVKLLEGMASADTASSPPVTAGGQDLGAIFKTDKHPDFDAFGNQVDAGGNIVAAPGEPLLPAHYTYSVNPARVAAGYYFTYCQDAQREDINWTIWKEFRDFHALTEDVDYSALPDFKGYGLTAKYYSGTNFETFLSQRVDPAVHFDLSDGSPAVGVPIDSFSVEWNGSLKAGHTETHTFKIIADNGARLWINDVLIINEWQDDGQHPIGTYTATVDLTAGAFYPIKAHWNEGGGPGEFRLFWSSASTPEQIIPPENLYPAAGSAAHYEAHVRFLTPTSMDDCLERIMFVSNSVMQRVDGELQFRCIEQLEPTFHFREGARHILSGRVAISRTDRRNVEMPNTFQATFRNLDSQYLEELLEPLKIVVPELLEEANNREILSAPLDLGSMNIWQARKVLRHYINRYFLNDLVATFDGSGLTYQNIVHDLVELTLGIYGFEQKLFQIVEATDQSPETTADVRTYRLQEWTANNVMKSSIGL
ncbi:MAG TPA: PA14 domain-containing protein [Pyrinomonadaceae bacterium]